MGILETIANNVAAVVVIRSDKDAINFLLRVIEENDIKLNDLDQTTLDFIKSR